MEQKTNNYQETKYEDETFVEECLAAFDEYVSKVEAEYANTSKSA